MECIVILNGGRPEIFDKAFFENKYVICADGAYSYAKKMGIKVDLLAGDFDSLAEIPQNINILRFDSDKDFTDGEIALDEAVKRGAEKITLIGASGGRDDHWYANIMLLYRALKKGVNASIKTDTCDIHMFDKDFKLGVKKGNYFSLVPFNGSLHIMNTEGLKYVIKDRTLYQTETLGISNITTAETVIIKVKSGCGIAFATNETAK